MALSSQTSSVGFSSSGGSRAGLPGAPMRWRVRSSRTRSAAGRAAFWASVQVRGWRAHSAWMASRTVKCGP
ncbi:MAG: hypothetical protein U0P46_05460 [Holophagaceae bacterium]